MRLHLALEATLGQNREKNMLNFGNSLTGLAEKVPSLFLNGCKFSYFLFYKSKIEKYTVGTLI